MGYYYIYDKDDYRTPKTLVEQDWTHTKVLKEVPNHFATREEAEDWAWRYNHDYISRAPYVVKHSEKD